jgi:HAD superfamily hydrolase (TIGR01509 family)
MAPKEGRIRGVLFDMDGTIVEVPYDWPRIKAALGSRDVPILSYLSGLREPERSAKWDILRGYEADATRRAVLKKGLRGFLKFLALHGIKTALVTNNSRHNTDILLGRFRLSFDLVMTRESGLWKPSGTPLVAAMRALGLLPRECCAVGDSHFDIRAAREAGIGCILILSRDGDKFSGSEAEVFPSYATLKKRVEALLP